MQLYVELVLNSVSKQIQSAKAGGTKMSGVGVGVGVGSGGKLAKARAAKAKSKVTDASSAGHAPQSHRRQASGDSASRGGIDGVESFTPNEWHVVTSAAGRAPAPRAHHVCLPLDRNRVLVAGGQARGGTLLSDAHILDLQAMSWSKAKPMPAAVAGGVPFEWDGRIMVLGGSPQPMKNEEDTSYFGAVSSYLSFAAEPPKPEKVRLLEYHRASGEWSEVLTTGSVPITKGGITATVVRWAGPGQEKKHDTLVVYGGEGEPGQFYSTVAFLNLGDMTWTLPVLGGPSPGARAYHTALLADNENQLIFFGGRNKNGVVQPGAALVVMDLKQSRWVDVEVAGVAPSAAARSGHSSVHVKKAWTHIGGMGAAAADTVAVDLESCSWIAAPGAAADIMPPIGGPTSKLDGRSLVIARYNSVTRRGTLLTFGGVDRSGRYVDELHVLTDHELCPQYTKLPEPERLGAPIIGWSNEDERQRVEENFRAMTNHPLLEEHQSVADEDKLQGNQALASSGKSGSKMKQSTLVEKGVGLLSPEELEVYPSDDRDDVLLKFQLAQREWELVEHTRAKEHKAALRALRESCERDADRRCAALQDDIERIANEADRRRGRLREELTALEQVHEEKMAKKERALGAREAEVEELEAALVLKNKERCEEMEKVFADKEARLREELDEERAEMMHKMDKLKDEMEAQQEEHEERWEGKIEKVLEDVKKTAEQRDLLVEKVAGLKAENISLAAELKKTAEALDLAQVQLKDDDLADEQMDLLRAKSQMLAAESAKEIKERDARIVELESAIVSAERKLEQMKMENEYTISRMKDSREKAVRDTEKAKEAEMNELKVKLAHTQEELYNRSVIMEEAKVRFPEMERFMRTVGDGSSGGGGNGFFGGMFGGDRGGGGMGGGTGSGMGSGMGGGGMGFGMGGGMGGGMHGGYHGRGPMGGGMGAHSYGNGGYGAPPQRGWLW